jgi:hypothetical protein
MSKDYTPSGFNARELTQAQRTLLLTHLTHAFDTRGHRVQGWVAKCVARIKGNLKDDTQNVSPRIVNRLRRAIALNREAGFTPRLTAALVKHLDAC